MKDLFDAIKTKVIGTPHNDFYNDIGGRFYLERVIQAAIFPYCAYSVIADVPQFYMGGNSGGELDMVLIQFTIFDTEPSAINIESYFAHLKNLFDDCVLTITGKTLLWMKRETSRLLKDENGVWCRSVDYRCYIQ